MYLEIKIECKNCTFQVCKKMNKVKFASSHRCILCLFACYLQRLHHEKIKKKSLKNVGLLVCFTTYK